MWWKQASKQSRRTALVFMLCEKLLLFISVFASIQSTLLVYCESCIHIPNNHTAEHTADLWHGRQEALLKQNSSFFPQLRANTCWMMNCADKTSQSAHTIQLLSSCEVLKYTDESEGVALTGCYLLLECDASHDLIMIHQGQLVQLLWAQVWVCTLLFPAERRNKHTSEMCINSKRQDKPHKQSYYLCVNGINLYISVLAVSSLSHCIFNKLLCYHSQIYKHQYSW